MPTVADLLSDVEALAPPSQAFPWDRIGLQIGDPGAEVTRVCVTLDSSQAAAAFAKAEDCQAIVGHHPVIWDPLKSLRADHPRQAAALAMAQHGQALIAAHTNWDSADHGINGTLCELLSLRQVRRFGSGADSAQAKIVVFCPEHKAPHVIDAMTKAGAGSIGAYERCAFHTNGMGTFIGGPGSNPAVGQAGVIEEVEEARIEMVAPMALAQQVAQAARQAHPYEEPATDIYPLTGGESWGMGRVGECDATTAAELTAQLDDLLSTRTLCFGNAEIKSLAIVGGAAGGEWRAAQASGADALLTGEVKQDVMLAAMEAGFTVLAAGHYATEQPGMKTMAGRLKEKGWDARLHEPKPGTAGRPL